MLVGVTLAAGVATWALSPIKFQADMGVLLAFMFVWNMVGAVVLIPALSYYLLNPARKRRRPRRSCRPDGDRQQPAARCRGGRRCRPPPLPSARRLRHRCAARPSESAPRRCASWTPARADAARTVLLFNGIGTRLETAAPFIAGFRAHARDRLRRAGRRRVAGPVAAVPAERGRAPGRSAARPSRGRGRRRGRRLVGRRSGTGVRAAPPGSAAAR